MNIYIAIACLLASANADGSLGLAGLGGLGALGGPGGLVYAPGHASLDYYAYPRYAFEYAVKDPHTGDNKAQWEKREGDVVKGAYSLVEPDGSLRVVEYWADDKSGFNAVVKRLGPNVHPTTAHAAPIYKAPIPVLGHGPVAAPISVGPVAQLGHLANAPLISGPAYGAVSTQSLVKESLPIVKTVIPSAPISEPLPILPAPIIKPAIFSEPIYKAGPLYSKPLGPLPSYKAPLPVYQAPLPIYKAPLPAYKAPLPIYKAPLPVYKDAPLPDHHPRYAFDYAVNDIVTKDNKAQWEARDGNLVKGSYSLVEPDGSLRVVDYKADDLTGFSAVVKRLGPNVHPTPLQHKVIAPLTQIPLGPTSTLPLVPIQPLPLLTPVNYGFGPAPLAIGVPKVASLGHWSLPWDPLTHSYGGWVPLNGPILPLGPGPYATIYSKKLATCLLAFAAVAAANPPATLSYLPYATVEKIPNPSYGFNYAVNDPSTGDNKGQWETRDGDVVRGAYSLVEPDGNVRLVEYTADSVHGFNAVVKRTGPNVHSIGLPVAAPIVHAPIAHAPIAHAPIAPIVPVAPIAAIDPEPIVHSPLITPVIDTAPIIAPYDVYPILPPAPSPWVHLSGATYGHKGNIVRRWTAGPISLDGHKLTIRTKH
ncbi:hypothetical protein MSG28_008820 [Choristoneura fumiferana]|uniref:Uncharacterized protein n=1 Tax=Choristoneura fumiferana TaxID=7141 RepID=A0ACC0J870_CHOFU|nr:hypothetical protein MSG28_008820 [Choristoneura fumiferana]